MWKERLWQVFLVAILGLTLTMCSRSSRNNSTSNSNTANADGTTTVIGGPSAISHTMTCRDSAYNTDTGVLTYEYCDASDNTVLHNYYYSITHDKAFAAGWKLVGSSCSYGGTSQRCALFHK